MVKLFMLSVVITSKHKQIFDILGKSAVASINKLLGGDHSDESGENLMKHLQDPTAGFGTVYCKLPNIHYEELNKLKENKVEVVLRIYLFYFQRNIILYFIKTKKKLYQGFHTLRETQKIFKLKKISGKVREFSFIF